MLCTGPAQSLVRDPTATAESQPLEEVLTALQPHLEPPSIPDAQAPVRACERYFRNRPGQFNYQAALDAGLPIGPGEIESAHRYVIQDRLKRPGAWWTPTNAETMLTLRTGRANREWDAYWQDLEQQAVLLSPIQVLVLITPTLS